MQDNNQSLGCLLSSARMFMDLLRKWWCFLWCKICEGVLCSRFSINAADLYHSLICSVMFSDSHRFMSDSEKKSLCDTIRATIYISRNSSVLVGVTFENDTSNSHVLSSWFEGIFVQICLSKFRSNESSAWKVEYLLDSCSFPTKSLGATNLWMICNSVGDFVMNQSQGWLNE